MEIRAGSGNPIRLLYVEAEGQIYVLPASNDAGWFSDAFRTGEARVRWGDGREARCAAEVIYSPNEVDRIRSQFRAKYGEAVYHNYFETARRGLRLDPSRVPRVPTPDELLRTEFESAASGYDDSLAMHPIDRYLKERTAGILLRALRGFDPLLEIGPGTGYHTLPLLVQGHRILAVDLSEAMLARLRARSTEAKVNERLETRTGRLRDIGPLLQDLPSGSVRGVYSAFGAFNLEPELAPAIRALARLLGTGGRLVFTTLNRSALAPMTWEMLAGRPRIALHRLSPVVPLGGSHYPLELYVPGLAGWDHLLRPGFRRIGMEAVSVVSPPFDSRRLEAFLGAAGAQRARRFDERLTRFPASWIFAEWIVLTYERTGLRVDSAGTS